MSRILGSEELGNKTSLGSYQSVHQGCIHPVDIMKFLSVQLLDENRVAEFEYEHMTA